MQAFSDFLGEETDFIVIVMEINRAILLFAHCIGSDFSRVFVSEDFRTDHICFGVAAHSCKHSVYFNVLLR